MLELDGIEYSIKTPAENTQDLVNYVNDHCLKNNIKNTEGDIIFIETNITSPIYLLFWALGYMTTVIQKLLYSIGRQYSVSASSERQLLNIATNVGLHRRPASFTMVRGVIFAKAAGVCEILTTHTITIMVEGVQYKFRPLFTRSIAAGGSEVMIFAADKLGPLVLSANAFTQFDIDIVNFDSMITDPSLPGRNIESIPSLRRRLLQRQMATSALDQAVQAIRGLQGVSACNIFYNINPISPVIIGGLSIPPRQTAIYLQGFNEKIAETFFSYTDRPCVNAPGSLRQDYTLLNGQTFSVFLITPAQRQLHVKVYTSEEISDALKIQVRKAVISVSMDVDVGDRVSTFQILEKMEPQFRVIGVLLSFNSGGPFTYSIRPEANEIVAFSSSNISIEVGT